MKIIIPSIIFTLFINSECKNWQHRNQNQVQQTSRETSIPESFDWRTLNATRPPRRMKNETHQWAFAVTAAVELSLFKYNGTSKYLSAQHLIDCVAPQNVLGALYSYFIKGATSEKLYEYTGREQRCKSAPSKIFTSYEYIDANETTLQAIVANKGSLIVSIDGVNLPDYKSGIIDGSQCEQNEEKYKKPWNAVIIGYGTENGTDYWILKNAFGPKWGEQGYFRLKRGINACGITNEVWSSEVIGHTKDANS